MPEGPGKFGWCVHSSELEHKIYCFTCFVQIHTILYQLAACIQLVLVLFCLRPFFVDLYVKCVQVVCRAPANHYCVDTRDPVCGHACKYRNLERLSLVEKYYGKRDEAELESRTAVTKRDVARQLPRSYAYLETHYMNPGYGNMFAP